MFDTEKVGEVAGGRQKKLHAGLTASVRWVRWY